MIQLVLCAMVAVSSAAQLCSVTGTVTDNGGRPLPGAEVYLEQGLEGPVRATRADADGRYAFENVFPGVVGVFARHTAHAWGGASVSLGLGQSASGVDLRLREPGSVSGHAYAGRNKPVSGVRVTRVALLTESPVSIPFSKMRRFGVSEPVTNARGEYTVENLPRGATVALKLAHPRFAQARIDDAKVGGRSADVTLYEGVLVTGRVLASGTDRPVAEAVVSIRNANPPHDTAIVVTDGQGNFGVRLLPGAYLYKAGGPRFESAGWQALALSGELPVKQLELRVAASGEVRGKVLDAATGEPIQGARVYLTTEGAPAAMARTGPTGEYALSAMAGENAVRLEPAPGYRPPTTPGTRFTVSAGESTELPAFWLAPLPRYVLKVVGTDDEPVAGAVIRLVRPAQFGWQVANAAGTARLGFSNLPSDGRVAGIVEHPRRNEAAVFSIVPDQSEDAVVQLLPLAGVSGRVVDGSGEPLEGAVVDGLLYDETFEDTILLWRTVTGPDGEYTAPLAPAQVAQTVTAYTVNEFGGIEARGGVKTVVVPPEGSRRIDAIEVPGATAGESVLGERLRWTDGEHLCGPEPPGRRDTGAAIVQYSSAAEAEAVVATLEAAAQVLGDRYDYAVVVNGDVECAAERVTVLKGTAPGTAATYVLDESGAVVLETFGLPPMRALR